LTKERERLQSWVDPVDRAASPNELACMIILAELQLRKKLISEIGATK
jgi:hypothetical protein